MIHKLVLLITFACLLQPILAQEADLVFINGQIYTANSSQEFVSSIAVKGNQIIYVGQDLGVQTYVGANTKSYDLEQKVMLPGLHDVHNHILEASSTAGASCILDGWESDPEVLGDAFYECNPTTNSNGWILGYGHSIFTLLDATRPTKEILDDIFPDTPVCILEETSHSVWVNSAALELMAIDDYTADPAGGHIYKYWATGEVDGILMDAAGDMVLQTALASNSTIDQAHYEGIRDFGLPLLAKNGITSMVEGRTYWENKYIEIWKRLNDQEELTCRMMLAPWIYPEMEDQAMINQISQFYEDQDPMLRIQQVKCYSDGITINATAALHEPYANNLDLPFDKGLSYIDEERLSNLVSELEKIGFDFFIHAIGDRGISEALNAIESARITNGDIGSRHRLTHLETMHENDYPRFEELSVVADFQVAADWTNPNQWQENIFFLGSERAMVFMPLKSIYEANGKVTLSSDFDVSTINPFQGIQHAITRSPQNLPSVQSAVDAYTINAAFTMRHEDKLGSIEVGKWADFIVLDQDIFTVDHNLIKNTKVIGTWMNGESIYELEGLTTKVEKEQALISELVLTPIPNHTYLKIDLSDTKIESLEIYDQGGALMSAHNIKGKEKHHLNTSKYQDGIYYIFGIKNSSVVSKSKFVVQH